MSRFQGLVEVLQEYTGLNRIGLYYVRQKDNPLGPKYMVVHHDQPIIGGPNDGGQEDVVRYCGLDLEEAHRIYSDGEKYERRME